MLTAALASPTWVAAATVAVEINFDELPNDSVVYDQYPNAVFTSPYGEVRAAEVWGAHSDPNAICAAEVGGPRNCTEDILVDFAIPVDDLRVWAGGVCSNCWAQIHIYTADGLAGSHWIPTILSVHMDFSQYQGVTRLELENTVGPVNLDDFTYTYQQPSAIPALGPLGAAVMAMVIAVAGVLVARRLAVPW